MCINHSGQSAKYEYCNHNQRRGIGIIFPRPLEKYKKRNNN